MLGKTKEIGIRLSVKDKEIVERALKDMGRDGQAALRKIEDAGRPASAGLLGVNAAASAGKTAFFGFASGIAAGILSALSLTSAIAGVRDALDDMGDIADRSKATGLDVEFFQELTYQAGLAGVSYEDLGGALETFVRNAGQAEVGKGRMVTALKALNPELLANIQLARTQEERVRLAADAIDQASDASEKAALSAALFGSSGAKLVEVFKGGAEAIDAFAREARALGIVIDRDLIAKSEELGDELEVAQKIIDVNLKMALVNIAPTLVWFAQIIATAAGSVRRISDAVRSLPDQSSTSLDERMIELGHQQIEVENELIRLRRDRDESGGVNAAIFAADVDAQLARRAEIQAEERTILGILNARTPEEPALPELPPELPPSEAAADAANKAVREAEQLLQKLRTATEEYASTLAKLDGMRAAGLITQETHNRATAEAVLKLADAAKVADDYAAAQAALDQALARGIISETQYTDAVETMTTRRLEASNNWVDGVQLGLLRIAERSENLGGDIADTLVSGVQSFEDAWIKAIETGEFKWNDLAKQILLDIARMSTRNLITGPIAGLLGGLFGGGGGGVDPWAGLRMNANGNVYSGPGISAYSNSIVNRPTVFPFANGIGLMGEAGAEAIIPLRRGKDGRLGVGGSAGGPMSIVMAPVYQVDGSSLSSDQLLAVLERHSADLLRQVPGVVRKAMGQGFFG